MDFQIFYIFKNGFELSAFAAFLNKLRIIKKIITIF